MKNSLASLSNFVNQTSAPLIAAAFLVPGIASAEDWPQYRGPALTGISAETVSGIGEKTWSAEVGLGYGAPVISQGKLVISGHGKEEDTIFCLDSVTGKELWKHTYPQPLADLYFQGGTTGTATIDGDHVYYNAREGETFCLSLATGDIIWQTHLQKDHGYKKPTWGFTGAPLVQGEWIYLTAGDSGICLDKKTGDVIWKSKDEEAGYSSPYPVQAKGQGQDMVLFTNKRAYVAVNAKSGTEMWRHKWMTRYGVNAADPIFTGSSLFISSGYGKGATLLNWNGSGEPEKAWQNRDMKNQMNASVLIDGFLYGIDGNEGQDGTGLKCMELATGETKWLDESIGHGALCAAGDTLIVLSETGALQIGTASPSAWKPSEEKAVLDPKIWTVPVLSNGLIYCRNASGNLVAIAAKQ